MMNKHEQAWVVGDLNASRLSAARAGVYAMQEQAFNAIQKLMLSADSDEKRDAIYRAALTVLHLNAETIAHAAASTVHDYTRFYQSLPVASTEPLSEASTV